MKIAKQTKLPFENNHILHLWRKIMLAAWRAHQATVINISPEKATLPTILERIRAKLNNDTEPTEPFKTSSVIWQRKRTTEKNTCEHNTDEKIN
jgi:hypothetical protein